MLNNIPFDLYDFFGYLAAGVVVLATAAYIVPKDSIPTAWQGNLLGTALGIVAAYTAGHAIAQVSGFLLERNLTNRGIGRPEVFLLAEQEVRGWRGRLLPGYVQPLPRPTVDTILSDVPNNVRSDASRRAVFLYCWRRVRASVDTASRLDTFIALYGFCRNMAMATLLSALAILVSLAAAALGIGTAPNGALQWALLGGAVTPFLFYRYLKFYRQYTSEVFTRYETNTSERPPSRATE